MRPRAVDIRSDVLADGAVCGLSDAAFREWVKLWALGKVPVATRGELVHAGLIRTDGARVRPLSPRGGDGRALVKPTMTWDRSHCGTVRARDRGLCRYCRAPGRTIDHVTPKSRGGSDDLDNLVVCCAICNSRKWARTPEEAGMVLLPAPEVTDA